MWYPGLDLTGSPASVKTQGLLVPLTDASWPPWKLIRGWIQPSYQ